VPPLTPSPGRRRALRVLGSASLAPALAACSGAGSDKLIPYVIPPEDVIPGVASWYATVCRECPAGCGMLVRAREGRAVKAEGNPDHPVNRGALCVRGQAALQGLYDPDRIAGPFRVAPGRARERLSWDGGIKALADAIRASSGRLAFVTPLLTGSLDALIDRWIAGVGGGKRLRYEPFAYEPLRAASRLVFGQDAIPTFDFSSARMIVSFGADYLETWLSNVSAARGMREARRLDAGRRAELVHVEGRRSLTAASADSWLSVEPGSEMFLALAMTRAILDEGSSAVGGRERDALARLLAEHSPEAAAARTGIDAQETRRLARRFAAAQPSLAVGGGVAVSGTHATASQAAVHLLNYVAGNVGRSVRFGPDSAYGRATPHRAMRALVESMQRGEVELLLVSEANPAYTLPGFADALAKVRTVVSFSSALDETAGLASLLLPAHTPLEAWGDYEPVAGVHGLQQPVMSPVFDTRHLGDILVGVAKELGGPAGALFQEEDFAEFLRNRWTSLQQRLAPKQDFEAFWADARRRGGVFEEAKPQQVALAPALSQLRFEPPRFEGAERPLVLVAHPSLHHYDGRGANKPWLQEIPEATAKASWGSWAEVHPETCRSLGAASGQLVSLETSHGRIELPVLSTDSVRPGLVAVALGQGHTAYGRYAAGRGANAWTLLGAELEDASGGRVFLGQRVTLTPRPLWRPLPIGQAGDDQAGRGIAQAVRQGEAHPEPAHEEPSLYPAHEHPTHRWGMAIDVDACIGCNACVAACYAENNVPIVGPDALRLGREMSWLRVERYVERGADASDVRFVPMLCQHCDHAPCESVCPVYATYHNPEGLNAQVYNRCVGTRYCGNNCPYKVRRFNWFEYEFPAPLARQLNPDVTVRSKGVMEKCTFCIQRIQEAKDRAKDQGRALRDGEIVPACAQTCAANAITFGDLLDPASRVSVAARSSRGYRVFESLNTRPAITYLKKVLA
jgi:molybdopterin-containing oxidoreductase family iron-sulfur binding subunit